MANINQINSDGERIGYWEEHYQSGKLWFKGNYANSGSKTGLWEYYYSDGQLMCKGNYDKDRSIGYWEEYHPDGVLYKVKFYI